MDEAQGGDQVPYPRLCHKYLRRRSDKSDKSVQPGLQHFTVIRIHTESNDGPSVHELSKCTVMLQARTSECSKCTNLSWVELSAPRHESE